MTGKKEIDKETITVPNYIVEFGQAKEKGEYIWIVTKMRIQADTIKDANVRTTAASKFVIKELNKLRRVTE